MNKSVTVMLSSLTLTLALFVSACSPSSAAVPAQADENSKAAETFTDPFAYCTAIGTIDRPDERYTGETMPDAVIQGFIHSAGLQNTSAPLDIFKQTTIWRCMNNQVYTCNSGANLPCESKANTDKTPTQAMADFCKEKPDTNFIPMYVTGHETIYSWHCVQDAPELLEQIGEVDAAGYLESIWYPIEPAK